MPASFLTTSSSALLSRTLAAFGETEIREGGRYVWFAETATGTVYDQPVPCAIAPVKRRSSPLSGQLEIGEHEIAIQIDRDALPFVPDPANAVLFVIATAELTSAGYSPSTDDAKTYLLKSITEPMAGTTAVRILAALHGGE